MIKTAKSFPERIMHCLVLLLALSLLYGCGAVSKGNSPSSQSSSVVVTPATAQIRAGGTQLFVAVTGGPGPVSPGSSKSPLPRSVAGILRPGDADVIWSVNGIPGGNLTLGTIDSKGHYRAPVTLPSPNTARVTATSIAEPSVSATAPITLYNPIPMVTSVLPPTVSVGGFILTINGGNFVKGARVVFGNTVLQTAFVSTTQLTVTGTATHQQVGPVPVTVQNPDPGSTNSAGLTVQVDSSPPGDITSSTPIPSTLFGNYSQLMGWPLVHTGTLAGVEIAWAYVEQTKGVYVWNTLDKYVALANSNGVDFMWNHSGFPPWAVGGETDCSLRANWSLSQCSCQIAGDSVSVGCSSTVTDTTSLYNFTVAMASRYNGSNGHGMIANYNLGTEPNYSAATVAGVVKQVNTMHDAIRATNPNARILGIGLDVPTTYFAAGTYMDQFWAAGGTKDFDAISFHGYPHLPPYDNSPETINGYVAAIKAAFARNGIPSTMPMWDSEASYGDSTHGVTDPDAQAGWLARSYLEHWSNGVSRYYWYAYDDVSYGTLVTPSGNLDLAGLAYQQVYSWMVGATMSTPCSNGGSGTVWTCGLTLSNGVSALAVWNTAGSSSYSPSAEYSVYRDLGGNTTKIAGPVTIGTKPILLEISIPSQPPTM